MASPEFAGPKALGRLLEAVLSINAGLDLPAILERIIDAAVELVDARYGALGVLDDNKTELAQFITVGFDEAQRSQIGELPKGHGILGLLILEPTPIRLPDLREHPDSFGFPPNHPPMKSFLGVPISVRGEVFGNLYLTDKTTAETFSDVDQELVVTLAAAAGIAVENARLHNRVKDVAVLEDRERIARDLHDTVIQRLFAVGLALQGTTRLITDPDVTARVERAIDDLDLTVKHIRSAIFGLETTRGRGGLRDRIMAVAREAAGPLGFEPRVIFDGPIEATVPEAVADEMIPTLREALANIARHARASEALISVTASHDLVLEVADDGAGIANDHGTGLGLRNMANRAASLGGQFATLNRQPGTTIRWQVPLL